MGRYAQAKRRGGQRASDQVLTLRAPTDADWELGVFGGPEHLVVHRLATLPIGVSQLAVEYGTEAGPPFSSSANGTEEIVSLELDAEPGTWRARVAWADDEGNPLTDFSPVQSTVVA